jgi:membrane associated rhomboid family serine protease
MQNNLTPFRSLIFFVGLLWVLHVINVITGDWMHRFGLIPRSVNGLEGVLASPLIHGSFSHLISNTAGLLVLGALICIHGAGTFLRVTVFVAVVGGLATWLFARTGNHIGASGLVFGYFGYLVARGIVERTPKGIIIAVLVTLFYSGLLWGVLPGKKGISWEGHLFGFIAGLIAARWRIHVGSQQT